MRFGMKDRFPPRLSPLAFTARALALAAAASALVGAALAACSRDETSSGARRGGAGESCTRTDDCEPPLACLANVCTAPGGGSGGDGPGSGAGGGTGAAGATGGAGGPGSAGSGGSGGAEPDAGTLDAGPSAEAGPWSACDECLDEECAGPLAACDADCQAIEACIQMVCANLSAIGSPDEGPCQVHCQSLHPGAKEPHLAVANCAIDAPCLGPCQFFPTDYDACRAFMTKGDCAGAFAACNGSVACSNYRDCVFTCKTVGACLACDDTPEGAEGRELLEVYERCIASECIAEAWLP
jgi:hypothetical protein